MTQKEFEDKRRELVKEFAKLQPGDPRRAELMEEMTKLADEYFSKEE
jgi:hypothetical protein